MNLQALNPNRKAEMLQALDNQRTLIETLPTVTLCADCANFSQTTGMCSHWKTVVPKEAQKAGCNQWIEAMPF